MMQDDTRGNRSTSLGNEVELLGTGEKNVEIGNSISIDVLFLKTVNNCHRTYVLLVLNLRDIPGFRKEKYPSVLYRPIRILLV